MDELFTRLAAPFPADRVSWRVGSTNKDKSKGLALAYIDARDVMQRLDEAVGPANWQSRYPHADKKTVCEIGIKIDGEWVWKANGAGDSDIEAEKGALSDALKRAAVMWGIGRYLYDLESPWVALEDGRRIAPSEFARLQKLLGKTAGSTTDDKAEKAIAWARGYLELHRAQPTGEAQKDLAATNAKEIAAAKKYPGAAKLLADAGL